MIILRHPDTGGLMVAVDINGDGGEAQASHYESRGWERVSAALVAASEYTGREIGELDDLTRPELAGFAAHLDLPVEPKARKADVLAAIDEHFAQPDIEADIATDLLVSEPHPTDSTEES